MLLLVQIQYLDYPKPYTILNKTIRGMITNTMSSPLAATKKKNLITESASFLTLFIIIFLRNNDKFIANLGNL